jgi:hypothetical protein
MWFFVGIILAAAYVSYSSQPKVQVPKPAALEEFDFPQFEEGTAQVVTFGDCWTGDWMVLGVGNYRNSKIKTDSGK